MEEITLINLSSIPTYLINLEDATERLQGATAILNGINQPFTRFEGLRHQVGVIGCGLSHLKLLNEAQSPIFILEDDIECTKHLKEKIIIPSDADAIYLGVSNHGYVRNNVYGFRGTVLASRHSNDYLRVLNMCSTHAIIYLSEKYIEACRSVISSCLSKGIAFDVGLASIHRHFNILTPNDPWFYQKGQPEYTNFSLQV